MIKQLWQDCQAGFSYLKESVKELVLPMLPKEERTRSIVLFIIAYILTAAILTDRIAHVLAFSWLLYCIKR